MLKKQKKLEMEPLLKVSIISSPVHRPGDACIQTQKLMSILIFSTETFSSMGAYNVMTPIAIEKKIITKHDPNAHLKMNF